MDNKETSNCVKIYSMETVFGAWLLTELKKRNWSQSELARRAGVAHGTISNLINGNKGVGESTLNAIANAFHIPAVEVFRQAGLIPKVPKVSAREEQLLFMFRRMTEDQQNDVIKYSDFLLSK